MTVLNASSNPGGAGQGSANHVRVTFTFDGTAGKGLNASVITFFTITGRVVVTRMVPYCTTTLTQSLGTPTLALGVTGATSLFVGATTATAIASTAPFWFTTTPAVDSAIPATMKDIGIDANIIGTVGGTNNINGGVLVIDVWYEPLTDGAGLA